MMSTDAEQLLIVNYQKKLPTKFAEIQDAVNSNDGVGVQLQLHKLSGSAGMYGLNSVSAIARQLEDVLVSGKGLDSPSFHTLFKDLEAKINESQKT